MPDTPPDSNFMPRKEFLRDQPRTANAFSLMTISGSSFIRMYSFPAALIATLRRLFDQLSLVTAFREDVPQGLYEFTLDGKPWSSPKSVNSERLILQLLTVIYQYGYSFLSTIDYGREHDDRLAMAFSKPRSPSPSPRSSSPMGNVSQSSQDRPVKKIPFALSFPSATLLRVINPPLHMTPAILQAVRGSWPRGVVSEKKIGDASYEFKLKGYRWFQEDTFASDSLRHILTLLSSLDTHSFSLLASLSLSNRSRVKDLWIFTGLAPPDNQEASFSDSPGSSNYASRGQDLPPSVGPVSQHRRHVTAPTAPPTYPQNQPPYPYPYPPPPTHHTRAATDRTYASGWSPEPHSPLPGGMLRKPAPRAQVPISVNLDASLEMEPEEQEQFRAQLPSVVSSGNENMTGVGAVARGGRDPGYTPDLIYATSSEGGDYVGPPPMPVPMPMPVPGGPISPHAQRSRSPTPTNERPVRPVSSRMKTPPLLTTLSRSGSPAVRSLHSPTTPTQTSAGVDQIPTQRTPTPPQELLSPGVFANNLIRDSTATDITDASQEIPIKWTGIGEIESGKPQRPEGSQLRRLSSGPHLPGAWSPVDEKDETATLGQEVDIETDKGHDTQAQELSLIQEKTPERPLHDVDARVASPELVGGGADWTRKSEAGLIGVMSTASPSPPPQEEEKKETAVEPQPPAPGSREASGNGWVLVNVAREGDIQFPVAQSSGASGTEPPKSPPAVTSAAVSPAAKSIVIKDAKDSKPVKTKGKTKADAKGSSGVGSRPSGLKRLLSFSKRGESTNETSDPNPTLAPPSSYTGPGDQSDHAKNSKNPPRARLREKLKLIGVAEASPRSMDDKRLSID